MSKNFCYIFILLISLINNAESAVCTEFEHALGHSLDRLELGAAASVEARTITKASWDMPSASHYRAKYNVKKEVSTGNAKFIEQIKNDEKLGYKGAIYFDVENSIQKKLNDIVIRDKQMVDAANNSFMEKFRAEVEKSSILKSTLGHEYRDYKSLRLRLNPSDKISKEEIQRELERAFSAANKKFSDEFESLGLAKIIPPMNDGTHDVRTWYLSGLGDSAIKANMAARRARDVNFLSGQSSLINYKTQLDGLYTDAQKLKGLSGQFAKENNHIQNGIFEQLDSHNAIPSKASIALMRKYRPEDFTTIDEYVSFMQEKMKNFSGLDVDRSMIVDMTHYFQKIDSISPPMYQVTRTQINLQEAKAGIVSVDFAGIGVDNAYAQMKAISKVNLTADKDRALTQLFKKSQEGIDSVTDHLDSAKNYFGKNVQDVDLSKGKVHFSGDDGIYMPDKNWGVEDKKNLLKKLAEHEDPAKFRVTFVKTEFPNGEVIPAGQRSNFIVRAETIEKQIREKATGADKIPLSDAQKMIIGIDYSPTPKGAQVNIIVSGKKLSLHEKEVLIKSVRESLGKNSGEEFGVLIEI